MQQVLAKKGRITLEEVPAPEIGANELLIQTHVSLISTGTELTGLAASGEPLVKRAINEPQNLKKALKMGSEKGFLNTYKIIKGMLDFGTPVGYSLAGEVVRVGRAVTDVRPGDMVACAGAKIANHAEFVAVPRLLLAKIPAGVEMRQAASVTLGTIALQGIRQAAPQLGETVAVMGLGLLGQLTVQMLRANGCRVIGFEVSAERAQLAKKLGCETVLLPSEKDAVKNLTNGLGVDATIITATSDSDELVNSAIEITRKRGRVVVVGQVGLKVARAGWYEKEIDLKISCSYGPGRYDPAYEQEGRDYPVGYVRWTENRNMEAYLQLLAEKKVDFLALNPLEFALEDAVSAYEKLKEERPLAVLLKYSGEKKEPQKKIAIAGSAKKTTGRLRMGIIGAGTFAAVTHFPNLAKLKNLFELRAVASKKGLAAKQFASQYDADYCTSDYREILNDKEIDAVLIATRHSTHARFALEALQAGKHVFVEKPLAVNQEELNEIKDFYDRSARQNASAPILFTGFNRRFSPFAKRIKELTQKRTAPLTIHYRVNAGALPPDHWTLSPGEGGRIIGEACHMLDLFQYWTGAEPVSTEATGNARDNFSATVKWSDGSLTHLLYTSIGSRDLPKEYAEIYCDGMTLVLDDFKRLKVYGGEGSMRSFTQQKGHREELEAFAEGVKKGAWPMTLKELIATTELSFEIDKQLSSVSS